MSTNTKIEWCDHTFNPWEGCQKVGPGCDNCYAEARNARFGGGTATNWGPGAPRRRTSAANWALPKRWNAQADAFMAQHGRRQRVFCASLADVFDNAVDREWRDDLATLILSTPNLEWLLLTKRIGNAGQMLGEMFLDGPPDNIRVGTTICNQPEADHNVPKLLALGLPNFLSVEPLLGPVDLDPVACLPCQNSHDIVMDPETGGHECCRACDFTGVSEKWGVDWVIVGGESGPGARPMHPDWARSLRDQCRQAGVPFLFKQWGEWAPGENVEQQRGIVATAKWFNDAWSFHEEDLAGTDGHIDDEPDLYRIGKKAAGRHLDGRTHDEFPGATAA